MPLVDVISAAALISLLVVAFAHPSGRVELAVGVGAAALVLVTGAVSRADAWAETRDLLPVALFLVASLVVAEACAVAGVFGYLGGVVARLGAHDPVRTLGVAFGVAAVVTAVLSLDATVVMLTPVVLAASAGHAAARPLARLCVRLANSASLLLPVSNLTNLLALPALGLGFGRWVAVLALPWLAVLVVEYVALRRWYAADLTGSLPVAPSTVEQPAPRFALTVLALMLVGFGVGSRFGVEPFWVAFAAAAVLSVPALATRRTGVRRLVHAAHLPFAVFVLGLGVVVAAVSGTFLGDLVAGLVPHGDGLLALLGVAALATVTCSVLNNLPATLLLVPMVAPYGVAPLLALLVGVNVGAGLTYTGSLANLLWRRVLVRAGRPPSTRGFHLYAAVVTPMAVVVPVLVIWAEAAAGWVP